MLPTGYRQGIISAITVLLGFSLLFVRFWAFEAEGAWSWHAVATVGLLVLSILGQMVALWRSLQVEDDDPVVYARTLRWFMGSVIVLFISVLAAGLSFSGVLPTPR
jgi:hypothetical protein